MQFKNLQQLIRLKIKSDRDYKVSIVTIVLGNEKRKEKICNFLLMLMSPLARADGLVRD
jgi:hypothetical protein